MLPSSRAHAGYAAVVAVGQFLQRSALRAASGGLFLLGWRQRKEDPKCWAAGLGAAISAAWADGRPSADRRGCRTGTSAGWVGGWRRRSRGS